MNRRNGPKDRHPSNPRQSDEQQQKVKHEINIENSGAGQPHNAKKEALGPNTKR